MKLLVILQEKILNATLELGNTSEAIFHHFESEEDVEEDQ